MHICLFIFGVFPGYTRLVALVYGSEHTTQRPLGGARLPRVTRQCHRLAALTVKVVVAAAVDAGQGILAPAAPGQGVAKQAAFGVPIDGQMLNGKVINWCIRI